MMPPPAIPECPLCGNSLAYTLDHEWACINPDCPEGLEGDTVFSLASYEADQRARKAYLDSLDNAVEDDDESEDE